jgi:putative ABC transport system permease protein
MAESHVTSQPTALVGQVTRISNLKFQTYAWHLKFDIRYLRFDMSVIWHKVWFDIWRNKVRTALVVLSIAVGIFAVGVTFGMSDQLLSGMDQAHQATVPSHIRMDLIHSIDRDTARSLKDIQGVEDVEPCNEIGVRYKVHPEDEWKQGGITMRDDFERQKYDMVQLKAGRWPKKDDVGIERFAGPYLNVDIGDRIIFKIGETERTLPISGRIRHPFLGPPDFGAPAYFFVDGEGLERFGVPDGQFSSLLIRVEPYSAEYAREVASAIKERLAKQGVSVAQTHYQDPNKHWARSMVEGILMVMQLLAVVSLFMSVFLVLNTVTALITQQTNQIGIIKAIGGRSRTIVKIYLTGVLVYGLLALLISLPSGMFAAFAMSQWLLNIFNIDYEAFQVSNQAIIFQALAAIIVPLMAALWPVLGGAAITVRQAIATYGLGSDFGSSWLDRAVESIGQRWLPSRYAIALGNMFRRKARLMLTQLVLVTAGATFLIVMSLSASVTLTLNNDLARRAYDVRLNFQDNQRIDRTVQIARSVDGVEEAAMWFRQPATVLQEGQRTQEAGAGIELVGLPVRDGIYQPLIVAGRWLEPGDGESKSRVIVMGRKTADDNHIRVGDKVTLDLGALGKERWQVIGLYQAIYGGDLNTLDALYAPQETAFEATKKYNQGAQLYVRTRYHDQDYADGVTTQIRDLYDGRKMDVASSETVYQIRKNAGDQFDTIVMMLLALAVIVAVVGGIGLMGALSINVVERTKEIGVLRAIGARSRTILSMFVMEGALQGLFSWAVAVPLSLLLSQAAANAMGQVMFQTDLSYHYDFAAVGIWLVVILIISVLASILPARHATRISVRDSLAYA